MISQENLDRLQRIDESNRGHTASNINLTLKIALDVYEDVRAHVEKDIEQRCSVSYRHGITGVGNHRFVNDRCMECGLIMNDKNNYITVTDDNSLHAAIQIFKKTGGTVKMESGNYGTHS